MKENAFTFAGNQRICTQRKLRKYAFTLAEVLICIGIVGFVAAITIPGLAYRIQAQILKVQFKNSTAKLNQALKGAK